MSEKYYEKMKGYLIFIDIVTLIGEGKEQISRKTNGIKTILYTFTM